VVDSCPTLFTFQASENTTINGTGTADFWVQCDPAAADGSAVGDGTFSYQVLKNGTPVAEDGFRDGQAQQGLCLGDEPERVVDEGIPVGDNVSLAPGDNLTLEVYWRAGPSDPGSAPFLQYLVASLETPSGFMAPGLPAGVLAKDADAAGNLTANVSGDAAALNVTAEDRRNGAQPGGQAHFQIRVHQDNGSEDVGYVMQTVEAPPDWQTEYEPDGGIVAPNQTRQNLLRVLVPNGTAHGDYTLVIVANGSESSSESVELTVGVGDPGQAPDDGGGNQTGPMPRPTPDQRNASAGNQSSLDEGEDGGDAPAVSTLATAAAVVAGAALAFAGRRRGRA
jgi:hypothetical protein